MPELLFARGAEGDPTHSEFSGERLLNMYLQRDPQAGVGRAIIAPSPGLTPWVTLGPRPVRAMRKVGSTLYAVCGGALWSISSAGVVTGLGAVPDDRQTTIADDGVTVAVAAGGAYRVWDGASMSSPTPGPLGPVGTVASINRRVVLSSLDDGRLAYSAVGDAKTIDALSFFTAEGRPDKMVRVFAQGSDLWLFGESSIEVWSDVGAADLPFARIAGAVLERGCADAMSVTADDNSLYWVGDDNIVYRANGYQPAVISTTRFSPSAGVGVAYTWRGAKHYVLRQESGAAPVYDAATQIWHERASGIDAGAWSGMCSATFAGSIRIGGADGVIYTIGGSLDGAQPILREGVSFPVAESRARFTVSETQLHFRTGANDIGRAAQVMMQCSRDGRIWGRERWRALGSVGQYDRLVRWKAWGNARSHHFRWRITDPIDVALYGATFEAG